MVAEASTERPIQTVPAVGRFTPGLGDARAGNVLERTTPGQRGSVLMQLQVVAGAGGGRDFERRFPGVQSCRSVDALIIHIMMQRSTGQKRTFRSL